MRTSNQNQSQLHVSFQLKPIASHPLPPLPASWAPLKELSCSSNIQGLKLSGYLGTMSAAHLWTALPGLGGRRRRNGKCSNCVSSVFSCAVAAPVTSSNERVDEVVLKQAALVREERWELKSRGGVEESVKDASLLNVAYDRCGEVCAEYAKTFYMGTLLMTPERRRAVWAIYELIGGISSRKIDCFVVICQSGHWCRRTDEPVDGPNASHI